MALIPTPNPNMYQEQFVSHLVVCLCPSAVAIRARHQRIHLPEASERDTYLLPL